MQRKDFLRCLRCKGNDGKLPACGYVSRFLSGKIERRIFLCGNKARFTATGGLREAFGLI